MSAGRRGGAQRWGAVILFVGLLFPGSGCVSGQGREPGPNAGGQHEASETALVEGCVANVLVAFHSRDGHTAQMAQAVAEGAREVEGTEVWLRKVSEVDEQRLLAADGLVLGSPVYNGNVTPEMQSFINGWPFERRPLEGRVGGAFVSAGGISAGEEAALHALHRAMLIFGMVIVGGEDWRGAFGASAVVDESPFIGQTSVDGRFLEKARGLGRRVAGYSRSLRCGASHPNR